MSAALVGRASLIIRLEMDAKKAVDDARIEAGNQWGAASSRPAIAVTRVSDAGNIIQKVDSVAVELLPLDAFLPKLKFVVDVVDKIAEVRQLFSCVYLIKLIIFS